MSELEKIVPEAQPEEIEVRTDIEAKWQMERRKKIIDDRDELIAFYEDQIRAVKEDADFKLGCIDRCLYAFFMTRPHQKTKTQEYVKLSCGKLMMKKQNPEYKRDDETVIAWLKQNNGAGYVKVVESLDWANLKKDSTVVGNSIVNSDGVVIPGVEVVQKPDKFAVEV